MGSFFDFHGSHGAKRVLVVAVFVVGAVVLVLFGSQRVAWIGAFPLEVHLVVNGNREVAKVSTQVVRWKEEAETLRADPREFEKHPVGFELKLTPVKFESGKPFEIDVPNSGTDFGFWRGSSYSQYEILIVLVEFADGWKQYAGVEIPDGRKQRKLLVELP